MSNIVGNRPLKLVDNGLLFTEKYKCRLPGIFNCDVKTNMNKVHAGFTVNNGNVASKAALTERQALRLP